jgi:putative hydrolase of the HAD superfamily
MTAPHRADGGPETTVVFDFGGVLFNWQPQDFLARLLPHRAATPEAAEALCGVFFENYRGDWGEFDRGAIGPDPLAERIARRTGLRVDEVRTVMDAVPHELQPIPGTVALLHRLHEMDRPLYFLSNMPAPYALHLERTHHFLELFRGGVFSSRAGMIKPEPEIFAHAAQVLGLVPERTLFIDDVADNVEAARAAGWQALHFVGPAACEAELLARGLLVP